MESTPPRAAQALTNESSGVSRIAQEQPSGCPPQFAAEDQLLTAAQIRKMNADISATTFWRWRHRTNPPFPPPTVTINGKDYWTLAVVRAYRAIMQKVA